MKKLLLLITLVFIGYTSTFASHLMGGEISYEASVLFPLIIGFIAAFITGILACTWMIKLVKNAKLSYFAIYCAVVGVITISYVLFFA